MKGYFIGIGGVGVNALANFALDFGMSVAGSDQKINTLCNKLIKRGARIFSGGKEISTEREKEISAEFENEVATECGNGMSNEQKKCIENADFLCFSSAISQQNQELLYAKSLGIPIFERHELLAEFSFLFSKVIAIAGTHGKTSTTAMLTQILLANNQKFVSMIGGEGVDFSNYVNNTNATSFDELKDCIFVCEACEYKRNLLALKPDIAVVTNCELDHPDCYDNIGELNDVFANFLQKANVKIVSNEYLYLLGMAKTPHKGYVVKAVQGEAVDTMRCAYKKSHATISLNEEIATLKLKDGGEYNYQNACMAIISAKCVGIKIDDAVRALESFKGVKRRFEYAGSISGAKVYFDFAHHPSEIRSAIKRAKTPHKMLVVFQPHTYSRTKAYLEDFASALGKKHNGVNTLVLMPVYGAREQKNEGVDSVVLVKAIFDKFRKKDVYLMDSDISTCDFVISHAKCFDVILMLGAGDIYELKDKLFPEIN